MFGQNIERVQHLSLHLLSFQQHPFFERLAMFKEQTLQELATVLRNGFFQARGTFRACDDAGAIMFVQRYLAQQLLKAMEVAGHDGVVELNGLAGDIQNGERIR